MRVLILTQYYYPEPVFKFADLARGLREKGHEIQVVTGFPCYPFGQTYDGYRQKLYEEEVIDGISVTRLPQYPDHSRSVIRRILYYLSFAVSAMTIGLWRARKADVMLVYQSALPVGLAAWVISRVRKIPYVCDVVDLWPESVAASGILQNRIAMAVIRRMIKFVYGGAAQVNVITEGYRENLMSMGVPAQKLSLIHCWPGKGQSDAVQGDPELAEKYRLSGRFNVFFAGTMGPVQDLRTVIDAAQFLEDLPAVQFVLIGDGVEHAELVEDARRKEVKNISFLGRKSPSELQQLFSFAEALLVHLKTDPMSGVSIPSKTFAYMAAGKPILMAVEGEAAQLVERHGCGIGVAPSNPSELAEVVRHLVKMSQDERQQMGNNAVAAYQEFYQADMQIAKFEKLLLSVIPLRRATSEIKPHHVAVTTTVKSTR